MVCSSVRTRRFYVFIISGEDYKSNPFRQQRTVESFFCKHFFSSSVCLMPFEIWPQNLANITTWPICVNSVILGLIVTIGKIVTIQNNIHNMLCFNKGICYDWKISFRVVAITPSRCIKTQAVLSYSDVSLQMSFKSIVRFQFIKCICLMVCLIYRTKWILLAIGSPRCSIWCG